MKEFLVDRTIDLPKKITRRALGEHALYIAPGNPTWLALGAEEAALLEELIKGGTIREAEERVSGRENVPLQRVRRSTVSLLEEIEVHGFYEGEGVEFKPDRFLLHWYVTNSCNLRCKPCYMNAGKKLDDELSTEESMRFIENFTEAKGPSRMTFTGGEPLTRPDVFGLAAYAKKHGHDTALLTNGTLIRSREDAKKVAAHFDFVQISLDGTAPETNDPIRGEGTFYDIVDAINYFDGLEPELNINMTVSGRNSDDIRDNIRSFASSLGNKKIGITLGALLNYGRGADECCEEDSLRGTVESVLKTLKAEGLNRRKVARNTKLTTCGYARCMVMASNGDVYGCPILHKELKLANVRKDGVQGALRSLEYEAERSSVENMSCHDACDLEYVCGGECKTKNYKMHGDINRPSCTESKKEKFYNAMLEQNLALREVRSRNR